MTIDALRHGITVEGDQQPGTNEPAALLRGVDEAGHPLALRLTRDELRQCIDVADRYAEELERFMAEEERELAGDASAGGGAARSGARQGGTGR